MVDALLSVYAVSLHI